MYSLNYNAKIRLHFLISLEYLTFYLNKMTLLLIRYLFAINDV